VAFDGADYARLKQLSEALEGCETDAAKLRVWRSVGETWRRIRATANPREKQAYHDCLEQMVDVWPV
jgi:hypothetical protein